MAGVVEYARVVVIVIRVVGYRRREILQQSLERMRGTLYGYLLCPYTPLKEGGSKSHGRGFGCGLGRWMRESDDIQSR